MARWGVQDNYGEWVQRTIESAVTAAAGRVFGRFTGFEEDIDRVFSDRGWRPAPSPGAPLLSDPLPDITPGPPAPGNFFTTPVPTPEGPVWSPPSTAPAAPSAPSVPTAPAPAPSPPAPRTPDVSPSSPSTSPWWAHVPKVRMVPGLLIDQWLELWRQYMNPQVIDWPQASERIVRREQQTRVQDHPEDPCQDYPIPDPIHGTITSSPCNAPELPEPVFTEGSIRSVDDVGDPYALGNPLLADPWVFEEPYVTIPQRTSRELPGQVRVPVDMPWPDELLPFRSRPRPRTRTRTTQPRTQPRARPVDEPTVPELEELLQPQQERPREPSLTEFQEPDVQSDPNIDKPPADPCTQQATEAKREQRAKRKQCVKFTTKEIRVCQLYSEK